MADGSQESIPETPQPQAATPVQYKVLDQPWSPSDPALTQAMLTAQGQQGWQLIAAWPSPVRERTRWVFGTPPAASGGGGTGGIPEAPADSLLYGRKSAAWSRAVDVAGDTMTGALKISGAGWPQFQMRDGNNMAFYKGGATRWLMSFDNGAESGSNAGSDFTIQRFDDAGNFISPAALSISRSDSYTMFGGQIVSNSGITVDTQYRSPLAANLFLTSAAGIGQFIKGSNAWVTRWVLWLGNTSPETGGDAGSDFHLDRCSDSGAYLGRSLSIERKTGDCTIGGNVILPADPTTPLQAATKQYADKKLPLTGGTLSGRLNMPASSTASAPLNLAPGVAPASPVDGDIWFDGAALKIRIGGVTKTVTLT
jgi:hypothetical protein